MIKTIALLVVLIAAFTLGGASAETGDFSYTKYGVMNEKYFTTTARWHSEVVGPYTIINAGNTGMEWKEAQRFCQRDHLGQPGWKMPSRSEIQEIAGLVKKGNGRTLSAWIDESQTYFNGYFQELKGGIDPHGEADLLCLKRGQVAVQKRVPEAEASVRENRPRDTMPVLTRVETDAERMARQPKPQPNPQAIAAERERTQRAAKEEAAMQVAKLEAETRQRKQCMRPEAQGMCGCTRFQAPPPGGWKVCGK